MTGWILCVRPVVGFPGYFVDRTGNVYCQRPWGPGRPPVVPRRLKPRKAGRGYHRVDLSIDGKRISHSVHRLAGSDRWRLHRVALDAQALGLRSLLAVSDPRSWRTGRGRPPGAGAAQTQAQEANQPTTDTTARSNTE
jgi:hypothetical protein